MGIAALGAPSLAQQFNAGGQKFHQKTVADLGQQAVAAVGNCDQAAFNGAAARMRRLASQLTQGAKTLRAAGQATTAAQAEADAKALTDLSASLSPQMKTCVAFKGRGFKFETAAVGVGVGRSFARDAAAAAKRCDRNAYLDVIKALDRTAQSIRSDAFANARDNPGNKKVEQASRQQLREAAMLTRLARWLTVKEEECFAHCKKKEDKTAKPKPEPKKPVRTGQAPLGQRRGLGGLLGGLLGRPSLIVSPHIGFSLGTNSARGTYRSTGAQAPHDGLNVTEAQTAINIGLDVFVPLNTILGDDPIARATAGQLLQFYGPAIGFGLRSGLLFQSDKVTYDIVRHGADGAVRLSERELANIGLYVMLGIPISIRIRKRAQVSLASLAQTSAPASTGGYWPFFLYGGVGPAFVNTQIDLRSNKVPGGGVFTNTKSTQWDTGLGAIAGLRTAVCAACAFGNPLTIGFEWQGRWMPGRSVATTSPTFGFTESGHVSDRFTQQFMFRISIPFTIGLR